MLPCGTGEPDETRNRSDTPPDSVLAEVDSEESEVDRSSELEAHIRTLFAPEVKQCTFVAHANSTVDELLRWTYVVAFGDLPGARGVSRHRS